MGGGLSGIDDASRRWCFSSELRSLEDTYKGDALAEVQAKARRHITSEMARHSALPFRNQEPEPQRARGRSARKQIRVGVLAAGDKSGNKHELGAIDSGRRYVSCSQLVLRNSLVAAPNAVHVSLL